MTEPEFTTRYFHATRIESSWETDTPVVYYNADGTVAVEGTLLEIDRPTRLVFSWNVRYNEAMAKGPASRVTFLLEPSDEVVKLTVIHDEFTEDSLVYEQVRGGWGQILCSLKSLLETGSSLAMTG